MELVLHQVALFLLFSYSLPWSVMTPDQEARGAWLPSCLGVTQVISPLPLVERARHELHTVRGGASAANSTLNTFRQSPEAVPSRTAAEHSMVIAICFLYLGHLRSSFERERKKRWLSGAMENAH